MSQAKDEKPQARTSRKKLVLVAVLVAGLLGGGGGAAWYSMRPADDSAGDARAEPRRKADPVFASLEPFTVNLADPDGDRVAQVGVVLELYDSKASAKITMLTPAVRNGILLLLSGKKSDELLTVEGKERLAREIAAVTGSHLGWSPLPADRPAQPDAAAEGGKARAKAADERNPVAAVHFSQFLVQ